MKHLLPCFRYISPAIAMRMVTFAFGVLPSFFNPIIYYYSRKDLRQATLKMLGVKRVHPQSPVPGVTGNTGKTGNTGNTGNTGDPAQ